MNDSIGNTPDSNPPGNQHNRIKNSFVSIQERKLGRVHLVLHKKIEGFACFGKSKQMSIKTVPIQDVWYYMFAQDPKRLLRSTPKVKRMPPKRVSVKKTLAVETTDLPIAVSEVVRISVHLFHFNNTSYFIESQTNKLYNVVDGRPGSLVGIWNPESQTIQDA